MFIKLPVYGDSYKWSSNHSVHSIWVKTSTISAIEEYEWSSTSNTNAVLTQEKSERPTVSIIRAGAEVFYCSLTADKAVKAVTKALEKEKSSPSSKEEEK